MNATGVFERLGTTHTLRGPELLPLEAGQQWRFAFDMNQCIGCHSCEVACGEQNGLPAETMWRRVGELEKKTEVGSRRFHLSMACNHCREPKCLEGCPTNAYVKLSSGIVSHQASECIGCQYCTWTCPYEVPVFQPDLRIVTKCDMCVPRLSAGMAPACVSACPTKAISVEAGFVEALIEEATDAAEIAIALHLPDPAITGSTTRIVLPHTWPESDGIGEDEPAVVGNHRMPEPEHAHLPLVWLTLLSQIAVGLSIAATISTTHRTGLSMSAALVAMAALAGSLVHLGRPLHAWKAMRNVRRSWLSREVAFLGAYTGMTVLCAAVVVFPRDASRASAMITLLSNVTVMAGVLGIAASAMLYKLPGRPAWNSWRTIGLFLGVATTAALFALSLVEPLPRFIAGVLFALAIHGALRIVHWQALNRLKENAAEESCALLLCRFRSLAATRVGTFVLGCALVTNALITSNAAALLVGGAVSILVSETIGRYLFYRTAVPVGMPGSFTRGRR